jgi:hypothetical protein
MLLQKGYFRVFLRGFTITDPPAGGKFLLQKEKIDS